MGNVKKESANPSPAGFNANGNKVSFWLKVKPNAPHAHLSLGPSGELQLELHAPPVDGQANEACVRFLASHLSLPRSSVEIVAGHRSRRKLIRVVGRAPEIVDRINALLNR